MYTTASPKIIAVRRKGQVDSQRSSNSESAEADLASIERRESRSS